MIRSPSDAVHPNNLFCDLELLEIQKRPLRVSVTVERLERTKGVLHHHHGGGGTSRRNSRCGTRQRATRVRLRAFRPDSRSTIRADLMGQEDGVPDFRLSHAGAAGAGRTRMGIEIHGTRSRARGLGEPLSSQPLILDTGQPRKAVEVTRNGPARDV